MKHLLTLFSLSLFVLSLGCNVEPEPKRCIDFQDHVLDSRVCQTPVQSVRVPGSINLLSSHRWYYGGYGGEDVGSKAWGGSDEPLRGHAYRPAGGEPDTLTPAAVANAPQPYASPHP